MKKAPIIVALDGMSRDKSLALAKQLSPFVWGFKVNDLLIDEGVSIIRELAEFGEVFADPKLHDIPNTVANGVARLSAAGAKLITVHAGGGQAMLQAAVEAAAGKAQILAITALTSLSKDDGELIYKRKIDQVVHDFAALALKSGAAGIVCSPNELDFLSKFAQFAQLLKVVPGIRPSWHAAKDDQQRISTPSDALKSGATYLVIGRPITADPDPEAAAQRICAEL